MTFDEKTINNKHSWADYLLLVSTFILLFWGLGQRSLWGSEGRWAEITREMLLTKDFFHPTIGGEPYFDKPFLTYWLIAGIAVIFGKLNEFVVRFPSAIAGVAAVWATMNIGKRLWSAQTGRIAGWILLTTYGLLFWSRAAAADTENLAAIMLCTAWYWARRDKPGFITFLVFYLIAFSGALTKGLTAPVIAVAVVLPDIIQEKRWKALLRPSHFLALAIGLGAYFAPFIYASAETVQNYRSSGLTLVFKENIQRFFAPFDHKEPFYVYFYHTPTLFMPWSVFLILGLIALIPRWKNLDDKTQWLLKAAALIFLVFTASGSRRNYYILPLIPFCALLVSVFLVYIRDSKLNDLRKLGVDIQQVVLAVIIFLELISPLAVPLALKFIKNKSGFQMPPGFYTANVIIGLAALICWIVLYNWRRLSKMPVQTEPRFMALIGVTVVILGGFFCWQLNLFESYRVSQAKFIAELKTQTADIAPERIGFLTSSNRSAAETLFYLDKPKPGIIIKDANRLKEFLEIQQPRALICQRRSIPDGLESQLAQSRLIAEDVQPWDSKSEKKKKLVAWIIKQPVNAEIKMAAAKEKASNEE